MSAEKAVIPYEKINSIDSLINKSEYGVFFSKHEFCSTLKGSAVGDNEYKISKIFYTLLKMRDLSDLNNLHNAQDVILLSWRSWKIDFKICLIKQRTLLENVIPLTN